MYASFEGFKIQNIKMSQIFSEFCDSVDTFHLPEKVGDEDFWPEGETFCENLNKRYFGLSVDDQAVSLSDDGTTIIIDFFSFLFSLLSFYRHSTRHTLHLHFNPD